MASTTTALNILVTAQTAAAKAQLASVDAQMKRMAATSGASGASLSKMNKGLLLGAGGAAALTGALAVAGKQLYDLGADFDKAYDRIRIGTGATGKELDRLKKDFRAVARTVPADFETVGVAIADLNTRLGLTGRPLQRMSRNVLELSRMTGTDLEGNIKSISRAFVDWEVPLKKQVKSLDGLFRLSQASGASVDELASSVQQFGSPLRTLGLDLDYAAAMFAQFERAGVNTQTMVPGLKFAIANISDPTEDLAKKLKALGVSADDPAAGLQKLFEAIGSESTLGKVEKINLAMDVFGRRAGADMAEAIRQGRFNVEKFLDVFNNGEDSIRKSSKATRDFSENMTVFFNKLKVALEPVATAVFAFMGRLSRVLSDLKIQKTVKAIGNVFRVTLRGIEQIFGPFIRVITAGFKAIVVAGQAANKFLSRDVPAAWNKVRNSARSLGNGLRDIFRSAWDNVVGVFKSGANAVLGVVNGIIGVINKIPGVDIGKVGNHFGSQNSWDNTNAVPVRKQRGGVLMGGKPSGDSIPAMLERGEYVLNRKAVQKIGVDRLNQLNFKQASRFQQGGAVGLIGGGAVDAVIDVAGAAKNAVGDVARAVLKPASFFLNLLPKPNIPPPLTGTGPWMIDKVTEWIKDKVSGLFASSSSGLPGYTGPPADMKKLGDNDWVDSHTLAVAAYLSKRFGVSVSSGYRSPEHNASVGGVPNSSHTRGSASNPGAIDFVPASTALQSFAGSHIAGLTENMIHDVGSGLHNHIAFFQRGGIVNTAKVARKAGWRGKDLATAIAVAGAESNYDPRANLVTSAEDSRGLWQINTYAHGGGNELYHPQTNANVAYRLWKEQGWGPWAGYTSGNYRAFFDRAREAMKMTRPGGGDKQGGKPKKPKGETWATGGVTPDGKAGTHFYPQDRLDKMAAAARKRGIRRGNAVLGRAKDILGEARNKKLGKKAISAANKAIEFAKSGDEGKANKWLKRAQNLANKAARTIPGLKGSRPPVGTDEWNADDPFSITNLPGFSKLPKGVRDMMKAPGLNWQGKRGLAAMALDAAALTDTKVDDAAALNVMLGLDRGKRRNAQKRFRKANAVLAKGGLTKKQRRKWTKIRNNALDTITSTTGDINSTKGQIAALNESDTESEADLAEAMKELAEAIKQQNQLQSSVQAVGSREALRMLSDVISGQIVGKRAGVQNYSGVRY